MNMAWLWLTIPLAPLIGVAGLLCWPTRLPAWLWLTCLPALGAAVWPPGPPFAPDFLWPAAEWGAADSLDRGWLGFTALLWACATIFAAGSIGAHRARFWTYWLLALSGNLLLIIAQDALSFYTGFTAMSLAAYGLIIHEGGSQPRRAGRLYMQVAIIAEMLLFAGLLLRSHGAGYSLSFEDWQSVPVDGTTLTVIFLGLGLKAGFWPLHFWLPLAHPAAPSPASAVLSGAMIEAGILGLWKCLSGAHPILSDWAEALAVLGLISIFYGGVIGLLSSRIKAVLAYSSVSQMGYFLVIVALSWRHPEHWLALSTLLVLFAVHHGLAKAALFLGTGIHRLAAWHWLLFILPALAISGMPLTSGGAVKAALEHTTTDSDFAHFTLVLSFASLATALLLTRALWLLRQTVGSGAPPGPKMLWPWAVLSLASVVLPWLWPLFRETLHESLSWSTSWKLLWPIGLALMISALALQLNLRVPAALRQWHTPAMGFSLWLRGQLQNPPIPAIKPQPNRQRWRHYERRWNRFWNERSVVSTSAWLLCLLLLLGLVW